LGYSVNFVNVGEATVSPDKFANLKAELYWKLRERFEAGEVAGLTDELTISQLASIRYKHNSRGQVVIESKEDARKRGVKSPDRAEALMLAYARTEPAVITFYRRELEHRKAVELALAQGRKPPERSRHNPLLERYWAVRAQWEKLSQETS
ncbi:MAG TPA: hypothetical protein VN742_03610, partial [Candidatus Binataceae bacterium]|nr:hypothetical protein [Candidatus Binataceae bacterium]